MRKRGAMVPRIAITALLLIVPLSGAAGAVGSIVCQIAKIHGCRVIGSAGSAAKTEWLVSRASRGRERPTQDKLRALMEDEPSAPAPDAIEVSVEDLQAFVGAFRLARNGRRGDITLVDGVHETLRFFVGVNFHRSAALGEDVDFFLVRVVVWRPGTRVRLIDRVAGQQVDEQRAKWRNPIAGKIAQLIERGKNAICGTGSQAD